MFFFIENVDASKSKFERVHRLMSFLRRQTSIVYTYFIIRFFFYHSLDSGTFYQLQLKFRRLKVFSDALQDYVPNKS